MESLRSSSISPKCASHLGIGLAESRVDLIDLHYLAVTAGDEVRLNPAVAEAGQHPGVPASVPRSDWQGRWQFALPSDFHCRRAGCTMEAATATPAVNAKPVRPVTRLRLIPAPFL